MMPQYLNQIPLPFFCTLRTYLHEKSNILRLERSLLYRIHMFKFQSNKIIFQNVMSAPTSDNNKDVECERNLKCNIKHECLEKLRCMQNYIQHDSRATSAVSSCRERHLGNKRLQHRPTKYYIIHGANNEMRPVYIISENFG
jgi:hypothetical protein